MERIYDDTFTPDADGFVTSGRAAMKALAGRESYTDLPTQQEWLEHMHTRCDPERGITCPLCHDCHSPPR